MSRVEPDRRMVVCRQFLPAIGILLPVLLAGCYAPLHSPGMPAHMLSDDFRYPMRTVPQPINFSTLAANQPAAYLLGSGDVLEVAIPDLIGPGQMAVMQVTVVEQGFISLPRVGPIPVGGLSLADAQNQINRTLVAGGLLQDPRATLRLVQKGTINVLVLGAVKKPGVHGLPRYENDVAHALAAAEGFTEEAGEVVEVHRRDGLPTPVMSMPQTASPANISPARQAAYHTPANEPALPQATWADMTSEMPPQLHVLPSYSTAPEISAGPQPPVQSAPANPIGPYQDYRQSPATQRPTVRGQSPLDFPPSPAGPQAMDWMPPALHAAAGTTPFTNAESPILRIPLRGDVSWVRPNDVILQPGDVVIVPQKTQDVFYVVGPLSQQSRVRFSVGDQDREIGSGLLLPRDREVDVVTAVAMAGYIDPIESPTTVTLHRVGPDGMPMLILVDLIAARSDPQETLLVQPGDIIYLNPDTAWYTRRLLDRVISQALGTAVGRWLTN